MRPFRRLPSQVFAQRVTELSQTQCGEPLNGRLDIAELFAGEAFSTKGGRLQGFDILAHHILGKKNFLLYIA